MACVFEVLGPYQSLGELAGLGPKTATVDARSHVPLIGKPSLASFVNWIAGDDEGEAGSFGRA